MSLLEPGGSRGPAGCRALVLVLCDLRQQDCISLAAGEEDRPPAATVTSHWTVRAGPRLLSAILAANW
ncbi:hypothetical protein L3Q82_003738 [Scortum barcoo]|uniref:Uncharacterized protein n=1 Tax=Scortum barcoo TaxID=214431 RepID=A0ACB8X6U7_9TELE|nr:hypothetical protein L3Q82_003738 [Scortum barcoo]